MLTNEYMDRKVTFPELAAMLALQTSLPLDGCEAYLREFIALVTQSLTEGETLRIKGFGTFRLQPIGARKSISVATGEEVEIPGHNRIVFIPAKELAEEVNAPFLAFEAVEIPDGADESAMSDNSDIRETVGTEEIIEDNIQEDLVSEEEDSVFDINHSVNEISRAQQVIEESDFIFTEQEPEAGLVPDIEPDENIQDSDNSSAPSVSESLSESEQSGPIVCNEVLPDQIVQPIPPVRRHSFLKGFLWGIVAGIVVCAAGILIGIAVIEWQLKHSEDPAPATPVAVGVVPVPAPTVGDVSDTLNSDTISVPTQPADVETRQSESDKPVYDIVTKTRYLTTMAKDHYGNYHLWPYIYEENKAILGHPDRIRPGTRVRIPSLEKYGVDPTNPADITEAKRKGARIYSRYR